MNSTLWKLTHLEHWRGISFLSERIYVIYDPDYKSRTALGAPGSQIITIAIHIFTASISHLIYTAINQRCIFAMLAFKQVKGDFTNISMFQ